MTSSNTERRARNAISRVRDWALAAADLLDEGATDGEVARALSTQFGERISARTVASFRKRDYAPIARDRLDKRDAARRVELILSGAAGSYAQAGQELLARMLFEMMSGAELEPKDLISAGKTFAKIRELDIAQMKAEVERERKAAADEIRDAVKDKTLSGDDLVAKVDELMGLKR